MMKTFARIAAIALPAIISLETSTVFAQGTLTPPGAPAASMKSLDQIYAKLDPRIPITNSSSVVAISQPGSYYLTTNLTVSSGNGIVISTNGVTLDLNGFTISSTSPSATATAILCSGNLRDITIFNGHIRSGVTNNGSGVFSGSGFDDGINTQSSSVNVYVSRITVSGVLGYGIVVGNGPSTVVESCIVRTAGTYGFAASVVKNCMAQDCGGDAINCGVADGCYAQSVGNGRGIYGRTVNNCVANANVAAAIDANTVQNSYGYTSGGSGYGINAAQNVSGCYGYAGGSGYGIFTITVGNSIGISVGNYGISAHSALNSRGETMAGIAYGMNVTSAENCIGYSTTGGGLSVSIANNCYGYSSSSYAISCTTANGCYGYAGTGTGIYGAVVNNSYGLSYGSGAAISTSVAIGCYAYNGSSGTGLSASQTAANCYGYSSSGTGLSALIANSCRGATSSGTAQTITYKYNMP